VDKYVIFIFICVFSKENIFAENKISDETEKLMRRPVLDPGFYPMNIALSDFDKLVKESGKSNKITLVVERSGG
jgi:hypothetical protein